MNAVAYQRQEEAECLRRLLAHWTIPTSIWVFGIFKFLYHVSKYVKYEIPSFHTHILIIFMIYFIWLYVLYCTLTFWLIFILEYIITFVQFCSSSVFQACIISPSRASTSSYFPSVLHIFPEIQIPRFYSLNEFLFPHQCKPYSILQVFHRGAWRCSNS